MKFEFLYRIGLIYGKWKYVIVGDNTIIPSLIYPLPQFICKFLPTELVALSFVQ